MYWQGRFGLGGGEKCSILFPDVAGNAELIEKTDIVKCAILSHFPCVRTPSSNAQSKHTPHTIISTPTKSNSSRHSSLS